MATLVVSAALTFFEVEGFFITLAAIASASYLDQRYVVPHLFPQDLKSNPLPAPKFSVDEGGGSNFPIGSAVRIPGQIIFLSAFRNFTHNNIPTFEIDVAVAYAKFTADAMRAAGVTLTLDTQVSNTDTMTVDTKTYTFQTTLTDVDGNIKIGASLAATQANLVAAMLLGGLAGTDYAASMTLHPTVAASLFTAANTSLLVAKAKGTAGNSIASTETFTAGTNVFSGATLAGGVDNDSTAAITKVWGTADEIWLSTIAKDVQTPNFKKIAVVFPKEITFLQTWEQRITSPAVPVGFDLTRFQNTGLTEAGWTNELNNVPGTKNVFARVKSSRRLAGGGTLLQVLVTSKIFEVSTSSMTQAIDVGGDRQLKQIGTAAPHVRNGRLLSPAPYETNTPPNFYLGTNAQAEDPTIKAAVSPGATIPAHMFVGYVVLKRLLLVDWGNRPPQLELLIDSTGTTTVAQAIGLILDRSVLRSSDWGTSQLTGLANVTGYNVLGLESPAKSLEPFILHYDLLVQTRAGVLHFFKRQDAEVVTVDVGDLMAHELGSEPPEGPLLIDEVGPAHLPTELTVVYIDEDEDHIERTATAKVIFPLSQTQGSTITTPKIDSKQSVPIPIAMSHSQARATAERLLWQAWVNRFKIRGHLSRKYFHILEGDVLDFSATIFGQAWRVLLTKVIKGKNGVIQFEGVSEESDALIQVQSWSNPGGFKVKPVWMSTIKSVIVGLNTPRF